jgi:transposase
MWKKRFLPQPPSVGTSYFRLSENDKVEIIILHEKGKSHAEIGEVIHRSRSTIQMFLDRYRRSHLLNMKLWRPGTPSDSSLIEIVNEPLLANRRESLRTTESFFLTSSLPNLSHETIRMIRHDLGYHFYQQIVATRLTTTHKEKRILFTQKVLSGVYNGPIVFTDESLIEMNLELGPEWRGKGERTPTTFFTRVQKDVRVMVWGGICTDGFKTPLLRIDGTETTESYLELLNNAQIIPLLNQHFGPGKFWYQEDNATPHIGASSILQRFVNRIPDWPALSPDLNPIEMIWDRLDRQIRGEVFKNADQLFKALENLWNALTEEEIINLTGSFLARCAVVIQHNGDSLNGRWNEVSNLHHSKS